MFPYSFNNIYNYLRFSNMYMSSQAIEEKLKRDCSIEELLDEDEIIQEMKNQNSKLLTYFNKENVRKLVEYITIEPKEDDNKTGHRYPFISSEILNCDVGKINDYFISTDKEIIIKERKTSNVSGTDNDLRLSDERVDKKEEYEESKEEHKEDNIEESKEGRNEETKNINDIILEPENINEYQNLNRNNIDLLDKLLEFIDTDGDLNYVLSGYFSKLLINLINKHPQKIITYIYNEKEYILDRIIQHCDKKSICDLIPKLLIIENYSDCIIDESIRRRLILKLFSRLNLNLDMEQINNIMFSCIELSENKIVLDKIINDEEIISKIFIVISEMCDTSNDYNYSEILIILINIIKLITIEGLKMPSYSAKEEDIVNSDNSKVVDNTLLGRLILDNLDKILLNFTIGEDKPINGTFGKSYKSLGSKRTRLVEFVLCLFNYFKNTSQVLDECILKTTFFSNLFTYFFEYEWNNLYQFNFDSLMKYYLKNISNHPILTDYLFNDYKILSHLMANDDKFSFNSSRTIHRGYFPVLIDLCNHINHSQNPTVRASFTQEWLHFTENKVNRFIKLFERKLCVQESNTAQEEENKINNKENQVEEIDNNPFKSNNEDIFSNNEDSDWTGAKIGQNDNNFIEDINGFEFIDENKNDLNYDHKIKVDEVEEDNFNSANYWKITNISDEEAIKILEELKL